MINLLFLLLACILACFLLCWAAVAITDRLDEREIHRAEAERQSKKGGS